MSEASGGLGQRAGELVEPRLVEHRVARGRHLVPLVLLPLGVLILALLFRQGMRGTDDLDYAGLAASLLHPETSGLSGGHHTARIGMILPLALVFSLFGVSDASLALLPLVCTVLTSVLIVLLARSLFGDAAAIAAGCLYALFPLTIDLATFFVPEAIASFELTLAALLFLSAVGGDGGHRRAFVAGLLIGSAYLTTEVGVMMLAVFGIWLGLTRLLDRRYLAVLAGSALVFGLELIYQAAANGDPFHRFNLTAQYASDPMVHAANQDLVDRLMKAYLRHLVYPTSDLGVFGPLLLAGGAWGLRQPRRCSFLLIWAAVFFGFYNFMSASLTHYVALPVASRLLMPGCVPLLILAGKGVADAWHWAGHLAKPGFGVAARVSLGAALGGLAAVSLLSMYMNSLIGFTALVARNAEAAADHLRSVSPLVLVSDPRSLQVVSFYREFDREDVFVDFEAVQNELDAQSQGSLEAAFVLLNGPLIHEEEIMGSPYGGMLSLRAGAELSRFLPNPDEETFSSSVERGRLFHALLGRPWVRAFMSPYQSRLGDRLFEPDPRLRRVQVFRFHSAGG